MRRMLPLIAAIALMSASACGGDSAAEPATPAPAAPATTTAADSSVEACKLNKDAVASDAGLMADGVVEGITAATKTSSDPAVAAAGDDLWTRYQEAVLAEGTADEFSTNIAVLTASANLATACIKGGFDRE